MKTVFFLLIIYQIKHFLADYPLQGKYMLGKFKPYPDFILPLLAHAGVHGLFTFLIVLCFRGPHLALSLGLMDMTIHFVVDRIKASPDLLGRFEALSKTEMKRIIKNKARIARKRLDHDYDWEKRTKKKLKSNVFFWWALGADQMAHHLTHYLIIYLLLR